jgi:hypothetical protein
MTSTEQRLADALAARAKAVNASSVRPLPLTIPVPERRPARSRQWLAPAAAAISIALVAAVVAVISRHAPGAGQEPPISSQHVKFHGELHDVDVLSATNAWAVGIFMKTRGQHLLESQTLFMHWDGRRWRRVTSPAVDGAALVSIAGSSPDDLWAVGTWNHDHNPTLPLIMHWNGSSWRLAPFFTGPTGGELFSVSAVSASDAWAVGSGKAGALILHWNGHKWRQLPAPDPVPSQFLESVAAVTANDVWAVGATNSGAIILHWNGTRWTLVRNPGSGDSQDNLLDLTVVSARDIWAVGYGSGQHGLVVLRWNGSAWHTEPGLNVLGKEFFNAGAATSPASLWVAGRTSTAVVLRHWNGTNWSVPVRFKHQIPGILYGISARSASDVWAIGNYGFGITEKPLVLHWNGTSWAKVLS